jgi:hypothetical protein
MILSLVGVTYKTGFALTIRFTDTLYRKIGTTGNYSSIIDLHTLQVTAAHTLGLSAFTSPIQATELNSLSLQITHEVFIAPPNSFLAISSQSP